jgi:hypothetical protein
MGGRAQTARSQAGFTWLGSCAKVAWDSRSMTKRLNTKVFYTENGGSEVVVNRYISYIYVAKFVCALHYS